MTKQMSYITLALLALVLFLGACSGWKKTSETTFTTSSTNVDVDTGPVKIHGNDKSSSIKIFGKEVKAKKKTEQFFPENPKQFINGDVCKYCDYIGRTENEQGNLIEVEIEKGFKNGEEREYHDGKIIRSSYYTEGRRSGMEYYYSEGKAIDSAFVETIFGREWDRNKVNAALPEPVASYIYKEYFQDSALGLYAFTLGNGKITQIARYNENQSDNTYSPIINIFFDNHQDFSNFRVVFRKPFYEEIVIKNKEIAERKKIKGNKTVLEFRQGEFSKEYYDNGAVKKFISGDAISLLEENSEQCRSLCQAKWFYKDGALHKENFYVDGQLKQEKEWNEKGQVIAEFEKLKSRRTYYDNGRLKDEYEGDVREEKSLVIMQNGTYKQWFPNGTLESKTERNDGVEISLQMWDSTGFLILDYMPNKYLKKMENTTPVKRKEWFGTVTADGKSTYSTDSVIEKEYIGEVLLYEYHQDGYNPFTKRFTKYHVCVYDSSSGTKRRDIVDRLDTIITVKEWAQQNNPELGYYLRYDYNASSYFKYYKEPDKLHTEFKGTSVWKLDGWRSTFPKYIDGTQTVYTPNGKKESVVIWKDGQRISGQKWNENGVMTIDFDSEKYVKFFSEETKKLMLHFKGVSKYETNGVLFIDGVAQTFDKSGNVVDTKTYKDEKVVETAE